MGNDGVLRISLDGDLDRGAVDSLDRDFLPFISAATAQSPLKALFLLGSLGNLSSTARKYLTKISADDRVGHIAFVSAPRRARVLGRFIEKAIGKNKISYFENEIQAVSWIKSDEVLIHST